MANFFLAALLCSLFGSFVCSLNFSQILLTPEEDKFIIKKKKKKKKLSSFYLAMTTIFYWRGQFPEYQTFLNFFLNDYLPWLLFYFPKDQNDKWTRLKIEQNMGNIH